MRNRKCCNWVRFFFFVFLNQIYEKSEGYYVSEFITINIAAGMNILIRNEKRFYTKENSDALDYSMGWTIKK